MGRGGGGHKQYWMGGWCEDDRRLEVPGQPQLLPNGVVVEHIATGGCGQLGALPSRDCASHSLCQGGRVSEHWVRGGHKQLTIHVTTSYFALLAALLRGRNTTGRETTKSLRSPPPHPPPPSMLGPGPWGCRPTARRPSAGPPGGATVDHPAAPCLHLRCPCCSPSLPHADRAGNRRHPRCRRPPNPPSKPHADRAGNRRCPQGHSHQSRTRGPVRRYSDGAES